MPARGRADQPRAVAGGQSARYEDRHLARGSVKRHAPSWPDGAAVQVLKGLQALHRSSKTKIFKDFCASLVGDAARTEGLLIACDKRMSLNDRQVARTIMAVHTERLKEALDRGDLQEARRRAHAMLKPMRVRALASKARPLTVPPAVAGPAKWTDWLSEEPQWDKARPIRPYKRILKGVARWDLSWMTGPGVVCYERAHGRVRTRLSSRARAS